MMLVRKLSAVLFFLCSSLVIGESVRKDFNTEKKAIGGPQEPEYIAKELGEMVQNLIKAPGRRDIGQFAYLYLQPITSEVITLKNQDVKRILEGAEGTKEIPAYVWPAKNVQSNFRLATPDYSQPTATNHGHSEYQLLVQNGMTSMINEFKEANHKECPQYIILYSELLPCSYPPNPVATEPRCSGMVTTARREVTAACQSRTAFYLYTRRETPSNAPKAMTKFITQSKGTYKIIWKYPTKTPIEKSVEMHNSKMSNHGVQLY